MYGKSILFFRKHFCMSSVGFCSKTSNNRLLDLLAGMPKVNSARIAEAQRQRINIQKRSEKYAPSTVYLQVLGSGAEGAPNTLYLFTDQKRYLFNCGECTQRLAHEHKVKLSRLDHIFITSKTWRNLGGLPGLSLTLQDVGVPNITLHGPPGLDELYNATKRFVIMKDMTVSMAKCSPLEEFEDNVMTVKYVLLGQDDELLTKDTDPMPKRPKLSEQPASTEFAEFIHDDTDYYGRRPDERARWGQGQHSPTRKPKSPPRKETDSVKRKTEKLLSDFKKKTNCSVSYICTLKKRLGTLDLAKCVERGVKPGPLLGQLKAGQDVLLPDGTLVMSKEVKTPDDPGPVFIVLDVPDLEDLKESEFSAHFDNGINPQENIPALVVHFTPKHNFNDERYQAFMGSFGPTAQHLVLNEQNSCLGSEAVHRTQHKLHLLDHEIFPLLRDVSVPPEWSAPPPTPRTDDPARLKGLEELRMKVALAQFQSIVNMDKCNKGDVAAGSPLLSVENGGEDRGKLNVLTPRTLSTYHLRPKKGIDRSSEPKLHIQEYIQECMDMEGFPHSLEQFRKLVESARLERAGERRDYPRVVFLGTGSCIPSKTRNTSAIAIHLDEERSMLLDCGEGTYGQLVRFYGAKQVPHFLASLRAVYVSHLHADHHIGLIGVLQARASALAALPEETKRAPLYLLAPGQIMAWLSMYDQQFERILPHFQLVPNQSLVAKSETEQPREQAAGVSPAVLASIGLSNIQTCYVSHCPNAFGVALEVGGDKITYSGDTIPCDDLAKLGYGSSLLIHEATMEDELADEARIKMHSTTSQAIEVGRAMGARYTVLTHFSQRYARLPRLSPQILNHNTSVGIAFDNMQITMSDLPLLPHMYAPLQLMFAEHCVELEMKAAQRARQKERVSRPTSPALPTGTQPILQHNSTRNHSTDTLNTGLSTSPRKMATNVSSRDITDVSHKISKLHNNFNRQDS